MDNTQRSLLFASLAVVLAAFLWAFDGVVLTPWVLDLGVTDVPTFVFMLHITGTVFLSYFLFTKREEFKILQRSDWIAFLLTAIFGGAVGTMAIIAAISQVYSEGLNISVILLLQKLQPIFAILLALVWLKERPRTSFYSWAIIALIGSFFLTFGFDPPSYTSKGMLAPALFALLAAFSFGSSTVFSKKAIAKVSHQTGTALRFLLTSVVMLIIIIIISILKFSGVEMPYEGFAGFSSISWNALLAFVVIALTTGGTAIFIYYWGLKRVRATRATIFEMAFPLSAILLEFFINGKTLSVGQWVGTIIVIGAIYAIVRTQTKQQEQHVI